MKCPFRVHKDNRDEFYVFSRTYGYQIATSPTIAADANLIIKLKRLRQNTNTVTAYLREGHISVGCNRVEITRTISTMTGVSTGRPNEVTFMQTFTQAEFDGFAYKKTLDRASATDYFIEYSIDVGGSPYKIGCCTLMPALQ